MSIGMGKKIKQTQQPQVSWGKAMKQVDQRREDLQRKADKVRLQKIMNGERPKKY